MTDELQTAELIPVAKWVYNLYRVAFWSGDPAVSRSRLLRTDYIASSCESHLRGDCNESAPSNCEWYSWDRIRENVGHPKVVGDLYGLPLHETGWEHGRRLSKELKLL